jgi:dihydrolipoamide dehydrogenase
VVEMMPTLLPGVDHDLVSILAKRMEKICSAVLLNTKVVEMKEAEDGIHVRLEGEALAKSGQAPEQVFEKVLVSVGRKPNSDLPGLEKTSPYSGSTA